MANRIKMAKKQSILVLWQQGWSYREIAKRVGVHRDTVSKHVRDAQAAAAGCLAAPVESKPAIVTAGTGDRDGPKPAIVTPGNCCGDGSKPAIVTPGNPGQRSKCEPFRDVIDGMLDLGLTAQRIYQDLAFDHAFTGSYSSVKRFVRRRTASSPLPFRRMECLPGEEAQVDFGRGAAVVDADGRRWFPHVFRMVLSYSRKGYSEAIRREKTEPFIRCMENAFRHFGGVPKTVVIDNLRAAVSRADWYDPDLNPKIQSFCRHYGTVLLPTKPYTPRHKGKIERGVGYVQDNGLKGKVFKSLAEENENLATWEVQVADHRIHGTTRRQVRERFEQERPSLLPLPAGYFPCFQEGQRCVHRDAHVEVEKSYYSVPPEHVGRRVWVRWDSRTVRIYNLRFEQVAIHARIEVGRFSTQQAHLDSRKISGVEMGAEALIARAAKVGPKAGEWARAMIGERGVAGIRVLLGLVALTRKHGSREIDDACGLALSHGAFKLRTVRQLIERHTQQDQFDFLSEHPLIRDMAEYGDLVPVSF
jgi:transposase